MRYPKESFKNTEIQVRNFQRTLPLVLTLVCECRRVTIDIGIEYSFLDFFWNLKVLKHFCWLLEISIIRCCKILLPTILTFGKRIVFNYNVIIIRRQEFTCQVNSFLREKRHKRNPKIYSIYLIEICFMQCDIYLISPIACNLWFKVCLFHLKSRKVGKYDRFRMFHWRSNFFFRFTILLKNNFFPTFFSENSFSCNIFQEMVNSKSKFKFLFLLIKL